MTQKRGGIGHRVGPLTRGDSFSSALHNNGFKLITCDSFEKIYGFPTIFELIEDIQNAGESQCAINYRPLHKDMLMAAAGIYQAMYGDEYGIQGKDPPVISPRSPQILVGLVGESLIKPRLEQRILLVGKQLSLKKNILKKEEQFQKEFNNGSRLVAKTEYSLFHPFTKS